MRLYSTYHRDEVDLPEPPGPIGIYTCGPTVYQRIHVGNAVPFVVSMWLKRWLEQLGYDVKLVENVTDINDKIYDAAPGRSAELAAEAAQWYVEDTDLLGLGRPDVEPKATESIQEIVALIEELVAAGFAYESDGDVYFRVSRFPEYGRLSNQRPDQMEEQEPNPRKEDPRDFALWKANKPDEDTWWDSPWGRGRPGWHIECSAMAERWLGPSFDIHMGGLDLVFPHHENELAQSRAAGREFARIWMHNGMLEFTGEKMSKSVGNVVTLREAVERWGRETLLVYFLSGHWRKPMDFDDEVLRQAQAVWNRLKEVVVDHTAPLPHGPSWDDFVNALDDDFNTPDALAILNRWQRIGDADNLTRGLEVFGLPRPAHHHRVSGTVTARGLASGTTEVVSQQIQDLLDKREVARRERNYALADTLRAEIEANGWEVQDTPSGPVVVQK